MMNEGVEQPHIDRYWENPENTIGKAIDKSGLHFVAIAFEGENREMFPDGISYAGEFGSSIKEGSKEHARCMTAMLVFMGCLPMYGDDGNIIAPYPVDQIRSTIRHAFGVDELPEEKFMSAIH